MLKLFQVVFLLLVASWVWAAPTSQYLKPYVFAEERSGLLSAVKSQVTEKLTADRWQVVGDYQPFKGALVIIVTHPELKKLAQTQKESRGVLFLLPQRVSLTETASGSVQIAYTNPYYFAAAYQVEQPVDVVADSLRQALGWKEEFGSNKGLPMNKLKDYKYAFGMERFGERLELAEHGDYKTAVQQVEAALKAGKGGTRKVYRLDVPGRDASVFGVQMSEGFSDKQVIDTVDIGKIKHTAYLPYEIVVDGGEVYALHPRFRIAISFPDTRMVGEHSFMKMMRAPDDINKALVNAAGGDYQEGSIGGFQE